MGWPTAAYARTVRLALEDTGVDDDLVEGR
jgi:hypothetical protein